jgi:hypothetical protein
MRSLRAASASIYAPYASALIVPPFFRGRAMDIVYLLLLVVLVGLTAGYIRLCERLEDRK